MARYKDGWHKVCGYSVYVENDRIMRGVKRDDNGGLVSAYPYHRDKRNGGWNECVGVKVDTFRCSYNYAMF